MNINEVIQAANYLIEGKVENKVLPNVFYLVRNDKGVQTIKRLDSVYKEKPEGGDYHNGINYETVRSFYKSATGLDFKKVDGIWTAGKYQILRGSDIKNPKWIGGSTTRGNVKH